MNTSSRISWYHGGRGALSGRHQLGKLLCQHLYLPGGDVHLFPPRQGRQLSSLIITTVAIAVIYVLFTLVFRVYLP
ncbi:hypothetical protein [Halomonas sp. H5]|uniref:hypothetical protein n=1 Tax=Halomonas sp. H5 TaxID=3423910 RepID=UPI003D36241B